MTPSPLRSWWVVLAFCPFWTPWISFVYIGLRAKRPLWIAWGDAGSLLDMPLRLVDDLRGRVVCLPL